MSNIYEVLPGQLDIKMSKGDSFSMNLRIGMDLTGYDFYAAYKDNTSELEITVDVISIAPTLSEIKLSLTKAQTALLQVKTYRWYLDFLISTTYERTAISGNFIVKDE
jgi:hypothetical protein